MNLLLLLLVADIYYVSPKGDDARDGKSEAKAWKTVARVNEATFAPGDQILFERGGQWRESLKASSSGAPGKPIVYGSYGKGGLPRFWGSDVLELGLFKPSGKSWAAPFPKPVAALLASHQFLLPTEWSWKDGILTVHRENPEKSGVFWTACVRVDLIHSNGKNHLVFKELAADESADARDGYGFRIMGSDDVRLESCQAFRAGRHHFGVINSSNFVGIKLHAEVAMPSCPGGSTFYVSFSDASRKNDSHQWIDCSGSKFENPGQGNYQVFYDHGEGLGPILIQNLTSLGGKFSIGSSATAPIKVKGGLIEDASLEAFGSHLQVDGLTIKGNGAVDQFGTDGLFENLLVLVEPKNGGPTGYGAGILLREGAQRNTIRHSTVLPVNAPCLKVLGKANRIQNCVLLSKKPSDTADAELEGNFTAGDPQLGEDNAPKRGSPLIGAAKGESPKKDHAGRPRPAPASVGAFEPSK